MLRTIIWRRIMFKMITRMEEEDTDEMIIWWMVVRRTILRRIIMFRMIIIRTVVLRIIMLRVTLLVLGSIEHAIKKG